LKIPVDRKVFDAVRNFYAAGLNYRAHIDWANSRGASHKVPAAPDIGYRSAAALIPSGGEIVIPADSPGPVEYEGELVAVIGKKAKDLTEGNALDCVQGYTLGNDVSERAWQKTDRTLWRAKSADTFKRWDRSSSAASIPWTSRSTCVSTAGPCRATTPAA
jgi:2-keto-4-pentenoate hydratase/2-oxohepta-3-ene-1,7-dioic acid hydratase in catechol pathway